jgi:hypothetical protein
MSHGDVCALDAIALVLLGQDCAHDFIVRPVVIVELDVVRKNVHGTASFKFLEGTAPRRRVFLFLSAMGGRGAGWQVGRTVVLDLGSEDYAFPIFARGVLLDV